MAKGNGDYCYVTVFANATVLADGSIDWYTIYSEAKEAEQLRKISSGRYTKLTKNREHTAERNVEYIRLNITKNVCEDHYFSRHSLYIVDHTGKAGNFIRGLAANIESVDIRKEFISRFGADTFEREVREGVFEKKMRVPFTFADGDKRWYSVETEAAKNPDTGDIEVLAAFNDIDNEVRLGMVVDRMLKNEYETVAQIDVRSGSLVTLGAVDEKKRKAGKLNYSKIWKASTEEMLPVEYWQEGVEALSLERVVSKLEDEDTYSCIFPVSSYDGKGERLCQWRFEYVDEVKETILMTRSNVSKRMDYGYDALTGLLGRRGFCKKVRRELRENPTDEYFLAEIDFDNFKFINENFGFPEGNRLIRRVGADLRKREEKLGEKCLVGHLEGDHFIILMNTDQKLAPEEMYRDLLRQMETYPKEFKLNLCMGVYEITDRSLDVEVMCDCTHLALKSCKGKFYKNISYYTPQLKDKMLDELMLAVNMRNALETEQFEIWFQPQVSTLDGGAVIGAEALVRWRHPTRGLLLPGAFIPIFEQNGAVFELDKYVWERACRYIRTRLDENEPVVPISVNISRLDILRPDFLSTIVSIVEKYDIPRELLHLEVTESAFVENEGIVIGVVNKLIEKGFIIAIDDFGSGYSSLSMLKNVPAHILKLDMRFFSVSESKTRNECILESVMRMAKMLGMAVLAEGVESEEQAKTLRILGCNCIQGYLYSKPICCSDYDEYVRNMGRENAEMPRMRTKEEMLAEYGRAQELFRSIITGSSDIIIVSDINTNQLLYANREAERYYGKSFDPMKTTTCFEYCSDKCEKCEDCPIHALKVGEQVDRLIVKNGRQLKAKYTRTEWNGHDAVIFSQTDISDEMRDGDLAVTLIGNIPAAIAVYAVSNNEMNRVFISERAAKMLNSNEGAYESVGMDAIYQKVHPDDRERVRTYASECIKERRAFSLQFSAEAAGGGYRRVRLDATPVIGSTGECLFYATYTDFDGGTDEP